MAKAKKQKASPKASSTETTKKKATKQVTRAKKPAAAKKATRAKAAAPAKRRATTVARPKASAVKKVARKAQPVRSTRKAAAKAPKASAAKKPTPAKTTIAAAPRILMAAPAEFHSPATTVAKMRAAAAKTPVAKAPTASVPRATTAKATPSKVVKPAKKAQRRPAKLTTLVVSPAAIDTSLAAEVAANMVLSHMVSGPKAGHLERAVTDAFSRASAAAASGPKRETSTFKHLKESVANPTSHHLDGLFGVIATQKRPRLPFGRLPTTTGQHIDKDFGLDVKRTNLLRRKAG